jgi:mRNA-degrading endonuclease RelE of RelBE toxin-antitoxin system
MYAQVKANVDKLDKKGKQRILQLLQKSLQQPDPAAQGKKQRSTRRRPT